MKLTVAAEDPGKDENVRITINCHYKDHYSNGYVLVIMFLKILFGSNVYLLCC